MCWLQAILLVRPALQISRFCTAVLRVTPSVGFCDVDGNRRVPNLIL